MQRPIDKNKYLDPRDPSYNHDYLYEEAIAEYEREREMEEDDRRARE